MSLDNYYDDFWTEGEHGAINQGYWKPMKSWMLEQLEEFNGHKINIYEAGCGNASFTPLLQEYADTLVATDISKSQIEKNSKLHPEIKFQFADLQKKLPFENDAFDLVWCSEVLEHLYFPHIAVEEFHRVLRPGGKLLVTVPFHGRFKNILIALFKFEEHYDPYYSHVQFFTEKSLTKVLHKSGFENIKISSCGMQKPLRDVFLKTNLLANATSNK